MKSKLQGVLIFSLGIIIYMFVNHKWGISIPCFFHEITGFYCPGCGITRMFFSLFKLDFYQAFRYNPLVFIMLFSYIIYKLLNFKYNIKVGKWVPYVMIGVALLFGILRNIDAFSYLKPTSL